MKHTLEELWNGNITPSDNCGVGDPEIENLVMLIERNKEILNKALDVQQKDIFEKYADCTEEYICLISTHAFRDGFCLATKLVTEALSEDT